MAGNSLVHQSTMRGSSLPKTTSNKSLLIQRSGAVAVKHHIAIILERCEQREIMSSHSADCRPPQQECDVLAGLSIDAYYQVVIAKHEGISTIVRAMKAFQDCPYFQVTCCDVISSLCTNSVLSKRLVRESGGYQTVLSAVLGHPTSKEVQAAASTAFLAMENTPDSPQQAKPETNRAA
jgi:hypothetical protein